MGVEPGTDERAPHLALVDDAPERRADAARTLVIIPTFQEVDNVEVVLRRVRCEVPWVDILVVDDNSPDGTARVAERIAGECGQIAVYRRRAKSGLGDAYRDGFAFGLEHGYEVLVQMDADLSHDPAALPALLRAVAEGADLAIGSRYIAGASIPHWSARRRALSRFGNVYAGFMLNLPASDLTSGFRAVRAEALRDASVETTRATGYAFQIEVAARIARTGRRVVEIPIAFTDRTRGWSKMSARIAVEAMVLVTWWGLQDRRPGAPRFDQPALGRHVNPRSASDVRAGSAPFERMKSTK